MLGPKNKKASSYTNLSRNLMAKIEQATSKTPAQVDELGFLINEPALLPQDQMIHLLQRAKNLTSTNQVKLMQAKKSLASKNKNTFLTGVNIYQEQRNEPIEQLIEEPECRDTNMLYEVSSIKTDDLQQLRRMIKDTGNRLNSYGRNLQKTRTCVMDAAQKFGKAMPSTGTLRYNNDRYSDFLPRIEEKMTMTNRRNMVKSRSNFKRT